MDRRIFKMLLCGALLALFSCVDKKYDLVGKEVSTDVKIEGNRITVPFGSMNAVTLDSIIDVDDVEILEKSENGMYCISVDDSISPVEVNVDPVKINIDSQSHTVEIDFKNVEIDTVHIEASHIDPINFDAPEISLDDIDEHLPILESKVNTSIVNDNIAELFKQLEDNPSLNLDVQVETTVSTGTQNIECDFTYTLPAEVETIHSIQLATSGAKESPHGTLVDVVILNSDVLQQLDKVVDFKITFPEYFVLYTDKYTLSAGKNEITANNLHLSGNRNIISFYIQEIGNLDQKIEDGVIDINENVTYSLDYSVNGSLNISSAIKPQDLEFNVELNVPLSFKDVKGKTKDIEVDFEPITMDFAGHFNDLEYIDTIYYIDFEAEHSCLRFESLMDTKWFENFKMKDGYALKIEFPQQLSISDRQSQYEGKGSDIKYDAADHAFYVYDLRALSNTHWSLALERLTLNIPIYNKECDIDVEANIYFVDGNKNRVDHLVLAGVELESMVAALDLLKGRKCAEFNMQSTDLMIDDAVVHTEVIKSELDTSTDFTINEEVPGEIGRLESVDFKQNVTMRFDLGVSGLDELDTEVHLNLYAIMPSFLNLSPSPKRASGVDVTVCGDTIFINADVNPYHYAHLTFDLECESLDFMTEEFGYNGMLPKDSTDGNSYLTYSGEIKVIGDAFIDEVDLHSDILEKLNDIVFDIDLKVEEMQVKTFHGEYRGEIDEVEESFDLDLGDELDFLKEEGNSITLAEPQIEILLENSICVPIDMDMQIFGRDDNGEIIQSSLLTERVSVLPAKYNEKTGEVTPVETKLFLTSDSNMVSKVGYNNVQISGLKRLLEKVPNSIDFNIKPLVNTSQTHHIDISKPLTFTGSYSVYIPLKFDDVNIHYTDTITGLADSFGENLDMLTNILVNAKMNVTNTIPLVLTMNIKALDINDKPIESIEVEPVLVKAGHGGSIKNTDQVAQEVAFAIKSSTGDFRTLDKLLLSVDAVSDYMTGSTGISNEQGIKISDIVFEILGDIETDLSE